MRHALIVISVLAALMVSLAGCSDAGAGRSLGVAEEVMEEHPDSALRLLEAIDRRALHTPGDRAKYALLLTQALVKGNVAVTDDSLISVAVAHYSAHEESADLMKSLFYYGKVKYYRNEMGAAIVPAMRARELAIRFGDDYWRAKAAELVSDIYSVSYYFDESIRFTGEAIDYYKKAGKIRNHRFSLCDLAIDRFNNGEDNNANVALLDSVLRIAQSDPMDISLTGCCLDAIIPALIRLGLYEKADTMVKKLESISDYFPVEPIYHAYKAEIAFGLGDPDMALIENRIADSIVSEPSEKATVYRIYSSIYMAKGLADSAKLYSDTILSLQNTTVKELLRQSVLTEEKKYYNERLKQEAEKAVKVRYGALFGAITAILVISALLVIFRIRIRLKDKEIENGIQEMTILTSENARKNKMIDSLSSSLSETMSRHEKDSHLWEEVDSERQRNEEKLKRQIENLFREQWKLLNTLGYEYFENKGSKTFKAEVSRRIEEVVNQINDPKNIRKIQDFLNENVDGIIDRMRTQCTFLKESDITFLSLIIAGLAPRIICMMTDIKLKSYYTKKKRISDRILESNAADKNWFILKLS